MTVFNVAGLLAEQPGAARQHVLRDHYLSLAPEVELAGPINGSLRLQRTNRSILVRGVVEAPLRRTCSRCGDPFVSEERVSIDEEYLPSVDLATGSPLARAEADDDVRLIDEHHEIDLTPVLREELALTEPIASLHAPDCVGLCPVCGQRLDVGMHEHGEAEPDPRLAPLGRLLERRD